MKILLNKYLIITLCIITGILIFYKVKEYPIRSLFNAPIKKVLFVGQEFVMNDLDFKNEGRLVHEYSFMRSTNKFSFVLQDESTITCRYTIKRTDSDKYFMCFIPVGERFRVGEVTCYLDELVSKDGVDILALMYKEQVSKQK